MTLKPAAIGWGCALSTATASTMALSAALRRSDSWAKNEFFDEQQAYSFRTSFDTRKFADTNNGNSFWPIGRGSCFLNFFPDLDYKRPEKPAEKDPSKFIPQNFKFQNSNQPVGCRVMKRSVLKSGHAFNYVSETSVQNERFGWGLVAAYTNIRDATSLSSEYWFFFLEKTGSKWILLGSGYWSYNLSSGGVTHNFSTKTPSGHEWKWDYQSSYKDPIQKIVNGTTANNDSLWKEKDDEDDGLWFVNKGAGSDLHYILEDGLVERYGFKCNVHFSCSNALDPLPFLKQMNMNQKGKWRRFKEYCESLTNGDKYRQVDGVKNLCFSGQRKSK